MREWLARLGDWLLFRAPTLMRDPGWTRSFSAVAMCRPPATFISLASYAAVCATLLAAAVAGCALPARRATRADPNAALRAE